jgi:hypothetical protein
LTLKLGVIGMGRARWLISFKVINNLSLSFPSLNPIS